MTDCSNVTAIMYRLYELDYRLGMDRQEEYETQVHDGDLESAMYSLDGLNAEIAFGNTSWPAHDAPFNADKSIPYPHVREGGTS